MTRFAAINLSRLSPPEAIEQIDYEVILAEMKASFLDVYDQMRVRDPDLPVIDTSHLESSFLAIIFEVCAYRETLVRQVGNDKYKAATLAYATGNDLENKAAELGVVRKTLDIGDPNANPPVAPVYEDDTDFRLRAQLAWEALTVAGSDGAYLFHALTAHDDVLDAAVFGPHSAELDTDTPEPGEVLVTILSRKDGGVASEELLAAVEAYLSDELRRPLTDNVTVEAAAVEEYEVDATIKVRPGASAEEVRLAAEKAVQQYVDEQYAINQAIRLSRVAAALYVGDDSGRSPVEDVVITEPQADIPANPRAAPRCVSVTVGVETV